MIEPLSGGRQSVPYEASQVLSIDATPSCEGGRRCIYNGNLVPGFGFWLR